MLNQEYAQLLVQALIRQQSAMKEFAARFGHLYEDQDFLMDTVFHPQNTVVMLREVVSDKMQEIKDKIVIITHRREEVGVNLESVMQEENDYFDLLLNNTPVARKQKDLHEELTRTLDG